MQEKRTLKFKISTLDALGQGVSKFGPKVTFIPKTATGDEGVAEIVSEKKGVIFAKMISLNVQSPMRQEPACEHFSTCPSCHYQHLSYDDELLNKKKNFENLVRNFPKTEIEVVPAPERFHYRNRIQLHYSIKLKLIGMLDASTNSIIPIPNCIIPCMEVSEELKRLYQNNQWLKEAPLNISQGHVEIYFNQGLIKTIWNKPYADGGFTQIFDQMNQVLKVKLNDFCKEGKEKGNNQILDLFAGNGNLSEELPHSQRLCVDIYPDQSQLKNHFIHQNLYDHHALKNILQQIKLRNLKISHLLLDPPRSGLKDFSIWLDEIKPEKVAYVSCNPQTLTRDLSQIRGYRFIKFALLDFFPSTFHFETVAFLQRE